MSMQKGGFETHIKQISQISIQTKEASCLQEKIQSLPYIPSTFSSDCGIHIQALDLDIDQESLDSIRSMAYDLKPWRKGPFYLFDLHIDAEWRSFMKWQLLESKVQLKGKKVADVGCNNGYYMFEMYRHEPDSIVGFDPSELAKRQFEFINFFLRLPIGFELLGIEDLYSYCKSIKNGFDVIFCLGVLYHRHDPIRGLKMLSNVLESGGELILDTLIYDSPLDVCLSPSPSYAKMKNVYFIPSISALRGWCERAKLYDFEILAIQPTTTQEQRHTEWISSQSLESFLNSDQTQSIEGYPPPVRGYFRVKKY